MIVFDVVIQALKTILRIQIEQPVLKRIFYVAALIENLIVSPPLVHVAAQQAHHIVQRLLIPREHDVRPARIIREAFFHHALTVPARPVTALEYLRFTMKMRGNGQPRQPSAQNPGDLLASLQMNRRRIHIRSRQILLEILHTLGRPHLIKSFRRLESGQTPFETQAIEQRRQIAFLSRWNMPRHQRAGK